MQMTMLAVLVVLLGTATAHLAPFIDNVVLEKLHASPFSALDGLQAGNGSHWHKDCKVTCSTPGAVEEVDLTSQKHCIGTLRVVCTLDIKGYKAMVGTKCEGSFGGFMCKERGTVFLKCDGKMVHWGVMDAPRPPKPPAGERPPFPPPPKGPMKLISVHGCIGTQSVMMKHPKHADGQPPMLASHPDPLAEAAWEHVQDVVNGNFTPVAEGRCDGTSFAVKKVRPARRHDAPAPEATLEEAEGMVDEEVDAVEHPGWLPSWLLPQPAPPTLFGSPRCDDAPPPPPHKGPPFRPHKMPGHCKLRCNGRRTFMRGALPCVGVFEADCHFHKPRHNASHDEPLAAQPRAAWLHLDERCPHHKGGAHLVAKCEGMFTGRFMGTKCRGFSFGTLTTPRMQLVGTCSKGQFMRAGPMRGGMGAVSVCTDKAMMVVMRGDIEEDGAVEHPVGNVAQA